MAYVIRYFNALSVPDVGLKKLCCMDNMLSMIHDSEGVDKRIFDAVKAKYQLDADIFKREERIQKSVNSGKFFNKQGRY